jgi:putative ABC transport system substrate-binding protein
VSAAIKRREFITLLGGAAAWPLAARAQQTERVRRIGALVNWAADDAEGQARLAAFEQGLQQLGWTVGSNVRIDYRWAAANADRFRTYAAELVALAPDVILAATTPGVAAVQQATRTVPIVFVTVIDPVSAGFVSNLARPGGNTTGFALAEYGSSAKLLELLKQIAPGVTRVAVVRDPTLVSGTGQLAAIQAVASSFGVKSCRGARRRRDRTRHRGLRAFRQWRFDRDREPGTGDSPQADHRAGSEVPATCGLSLPLQYR